MNKEVLKILQGLKTYIHPIQGYVPNMFYKQSETDIMKFYETHKERVIEIYDLLKKQLISSYITYEFEKLGISREAQISLSDSQISILMKTIKPIYLPDFHKK